MNKPESTNQIVPDTDILLQRIAELESENKRLSCLVADMSGEAEILSYRFALNELSFTESFGNLVTAVVDSAEKLTGSEIGFLHFYDELSDSIALKTWSTNTHKNCGVHPKIEHYSFKDAGVWVDCLREKKPVLCCIKMLEVLLTLF
ncbi:MAG TPA: GAF domain-containing protein [Bacteroidales bacterium]|nr:GAF domain-containing protein [Bacteroidales bacterium]